MFNLILVEPSCRKNIWTPKLVCGFIQNDQPRKGVSENGVSFLDTWGTPTTKWAIPVVVLKTPCVSLKTEWWKQGFSISKSFDPLLTSGLRHSQIHTGVEKTSFISDISSFPMANNGHKTPIFPSNPITLVSKNHHLSVFISDISSFPMVPMAMKPYKNPNLCSFNHHFHASFAGAQHTAEKKKNMRRRFTWHRMSGSASERWSNIGMQYIYIYYILYKFRNNFI